MAITLEIWEDSGPVLSSHGTTRQAVNNVGWKDSSLDETYGYYDYPLVRPQSPITETLSYHKYNYLKISGTYPKATRVRLQLIGDVAGAGVPTYTSTDKVKLYYKLTNTYSLPTNALLSSTTLHLGTTVILQPNLSLTGPEAASSRIFLLNTNTTYYTNYLVTQLWVDPGLWDEYGNIGAFSLRFLLDEYESTDV